MRNEKIQKHPPQDSGGYRRRLKEEEAYKGFTLVELIVVIVILAILAAILIPGLLKWIDQAKDKKYELEAREITQAAQAELTKIYAEGGIVGILEYWNTGSLEDHSWDMSDDDYNWVYPEEWFWDTWPINYVYLNGVYNEALVDYVYERDGEITVPGMREKLKDLTGADVKRLLFYGNWWGADDADRGNVTRPWDGSVSMVELWFVASDGAEICARYKSTDGWEIKKLPDGTWDYLLNNYL